MEDEATNRRVVDRPEYEPPCIERVLTSEDMEREVMFAGPAFTVGDAGPAPGG